MVVVPAVFAFGADTQAGPPLLFIVLPQVFQEMPFGNVFCFVFFLAVTCAAITSLVNLYEPPIEPCSKKRTCRAGQRSASSPLPRLP